MSEILAGSDVRASDGVVDGQSVAQRLEVTSSSK